MTLAAFAFVDVKGDGSSTVATVDLTTDAVSFAAGVSQAFTPNGALQIKRELSKGFKITSKNAPSAVSAVITDGTISVTGTVSGTLLTLTFASAPASDYVSRLAVELLFAV